jgi:Fe2+ transport system protein FeoA
MEQQCCNCFCKQTPQTLAELPIGTKATIVGISTKAKGKKKFADVGIVPGTELLIEAHAPLGSLIRVKVLSTSMALHKEDAACIMIEEKKEK